MQADVALENNVRGERSSEILKVVYLTAGKQVQFIVYCTCRKSLRTTFQFVVLFSNVTVSFKWIIVKVFT